MKRRITGWDVLTYMRLQDSGEAVAHRGRLYRVIGVWTDASLQWWVELETAQTATAQ